MRHWWWALLRWWHGLCVKSRGVSVEQVIRRDDDLRGPNQGDAGERPNANVDGSPSYIACGLECGVLREAEDEDLKYKVADSEGNEFGVFKPKRGVGGP